MESQFLPVVPIKAILLIYKIDDETMSRMQLPLRLALGCYSSQSARTDTSKSQTRMWVKRNC